MSLSIIRVERDVKDSLPAYAWPGGYSIIYLTQVGEVLCSSCATVELDELCEGDTPRDETDDILAYADVHMEGPPETCINCDGLIASAYGEVVDA